MSDNKYPRKAIIKSNLKNVVAHLEEMRGREFWVLAEITGPTCCGICYVFEFPEEIEDKYFEDLKYTYGLRKSAFDWV